MRMIWRVYGHLGGVILSGPAAMAIETKPTITLDLAKKMAVGCEAKAKQENWKMNIAVVNDGTKSGLLRAYGWRVPRQHLHLSAKGGHCCRIPSPRRGLSAS